LRGDVAGYEKLRRGISSEKLAAPPDVSPSVVSRAIKQRVDEPEVELDPTNEYVVVV
jgi:hypothetical protein